MIENLEKEALAEVMLAADLAALEVVRVKYVGRGDGLINSLTRVIKEQPADKRAEFGARVNQAKLNVEAAITAKAATFGKVEQARTLAASAVDVTLPGRVPARGSLHPLTLVTDEIIDVFARMGFGVETGPEVESDFYNFEALNFPDDHPARDMQDTFFAADPADGKPARVAHPNNPDKWVPALLRTHTSPVQIRTMLRKKKPPVRIIVPGAVYRNDSDQTHSPMFHQVEGLMVEDGISFADLKGVLAEFARAMFGAKAGIRLRPSFFPFVEPGAEVDVSCFLCTEQSRSGCRVCKGSGWLEILGAGMVHPEVFRHCGFDPERTQGFAFGLGVERVAMLRYRVPDIRLFFENDLRFLRQFA